MDKTVDLISDHTVTLTGKKSRIAYPESLRRVRFYDRENDRHLVILTNNFFLLALMIAQLYKLRLQAELFFRWIKQNLRIKSFYGTSENAVRTQIWVAITVYVLVAIIRKKTGTTLPFYTFLQVISIMAFENIPLNQLLTETAPHESQLAPCIQFKLINL